MNKHWGIVKSVINEIRDFSEETYPHGVFVSHPCSGYAKAEQKVFYFGQDTYWWMDKEAGGFDGMKRLFFSGEWR